MIRAIIFDIGNVLVKFDYQIAARRLQISAERWPAVEALKNRFERGDFTRAEFPGEVLRLLKHGGSDAEFLEIWEHIFEVNDWMIALVERLRENYPIYLLSNISDLHVDYLFATYPFFAWFRDAVYSYRIGSMKPEPAIYAQAILQFGFRADEMVFIDDLPVNVTAARAMGLHAIHYEKSDRDALLQALRALGVSC